MNLCDVFNQPIKITLYSNSIRSPKRITQLSVSDIKHKYHQPVRLYRCIILLITVCTLLGGKSNASECFYTTRGAPAVHNWPLYAI